MNQQEITEGNKLIAEFMSKENPFHEGQYIVFDGFAYTPDEMKFNTSWDWIMPVIQKIFSMPFGDTPGLSGYFDRHMDEYSFGFHCPIEFVFDKVVDFIKWYNYQKNKTHVPVS